MATSDLITGDDRSRGLNRVRSASTSVLLDVEFLVRLEALVNSKVANLDAVGKAELLEAAAAQLRSHEGLVGCRLVPFTPGWRPTDEALHPWLGSSDQAALILGGPDAASGDADAGVDNTAYVLFDVGGPSSGELGIDVTLTFRGIDGSQRAEPLPGWNRRHVTAMAFAPGDLGHPTLAPVRLSPGDGQRLALALSPERDLLPASDGGWSWDDLDPAIRARATDGEDPYTFGHLFAQQLHIAVRLTDQGVPIAAGSGSLFVCDTVRLGSLYQRLVDRLVAPDTARQAEAHRTADPGPSFHPWYPVLRIGGDKAWLYERALIGDIVHKRRNLSDPGWLLRVGLYLEFLTCLGIIEAVKDEVGDLLTPSERDAFEHSPLFSDIRRRIDPQAWREVWKLREIAFPHIGTPRTGPVAARNLLAKRRATLAFLEVHHDDLKQAIQLAGPNHHNAQETWQRVFRDAERAVLRQTPEAFPELGFLPPKVREFLLWHRRGRLGLERSLSAPTAITRLFGDQDGLYTSACVQYRRSMNAVADWAKQRALMDHTGAECIPPEVSLLESRIARPTQVAMLQRRDGYEERLDMAVELPASYERSVEEVEGLLGQVPIFTMLTSDERHELAGAARPISLGPLERLVVQGRKGSSLFVVVEGAVEVMLRREDGIDWPVDTMTKGAVVGEMSLLTGEPRTATVRAVTSATVYEIGRRQYEPLLRARPDLIDELARMVEERLRDRAKRLEAYDAERERTAIRERIRRFVVGE
jgi:CRP-like cAMP-binding protein